MPTLYLADLTFEGYTTMRLRLVDHYHRHVSAQEVHRPFRVRVFRHEAEADQVTIHTLLEMADEAEPAVFDIEPPMAGPLHVEAIQGRVLGTPDVLYTRLEHTEMFASPGTFTVDKASFLHSEIEETQT